MPKLDRFLPFLLVLLLFSTVNGQVTAVLKALDSMVQVGKPFKVELSVQHPVDMVVVFPDSAGDFAPYEWVETLPEATKTVNGTSTDVATYRLLTWEIDSVQSIQLPVKFLRAPGDTSTVSSNACTLLFDPVIEAYSDSLKLKLHEGLIPIREPFPWLGFVVMTALVSLLGLTLYFSLRSPFMKWLKKYRIQRDWKRFLTKHQGVLGKQGDWIAFSEAMQDNWKQYFDPNGALKLHAMTTADLAEILTQSEAWDDQDISILTEIGKIRDMAVFGGILSDGSRLVELHGILQLVMEKEFSKRKERVAS